MRKKRRAGAHLEEVIGTLRAHVPELRERYGVRTLGVFGSYVRRKERRGSDLDLLVEFDERPLTLFQFVELERHLSDLLGVKVDLVEKSALKPAIGRRVLEEVLPV
jgi:predicted nucleotidyltransferase